MALGDTIEKITSATGIKTVVDNVSEALNLDCGCENRKSILNNPNLLINKILYNHGVSNEKGSLRNGQHSNL
jgi:hypothetical protein